MGVKICIHQAADKIGGNCVEIVSQEGCRLLLDAGAPLDIAPKAIPVLPPSLDVSSEVMGVVLSHSHGDHWGLIPQMPPAWPVYAGEDTAFLLKMSCALGRTSLPQEIRTWLRRKGESPVVTIGPFTLRPRLMDHSALDAYALEIDVDGRRIFYTGDFRGHGRKGILTQNLIKYPPKNVDVLIMEGTNIPLADKPLKPVVSEDELEQRFTELFLQCRGRVFTTWSATNIDRLVTLYRACLKADRYLVLDLYSATMWEELSRFVQLPPITRNNKVRVVVTYKMKKMIQRMGYPDPVDDLKKEGVALAAAALENLPEKWVVMIRNSLAHNGYPGKVFPTRDDAWVWSMWSGYLTEPRYAEQNEKIKEFLAPCGPSQYIHTSGHASVELLHQVATAIAPRLLVPIHGEAWSGQDNNFENLKPLANGQWLEI